MTDRDPRVQALLERLVPPVADSGDWDGLMREARCGQGPGQRARATRLRGLGVRGRRVGAVVLVGVVAAVAVLPAFAVVNDWWFFGAGSPSPVGQVVVVRTGTTDGIGWTLAAFVSEQDGVCVALTPTGSTGAGVEACGSGIRGEPNLGSGVEGGGHWVGFVQATLTDSVGPSVFGPTADGVAQVDVELDDGRLVAATVVHGPARLAAPIDFYVVEIPRGASVVAVLARDKNGTLLERRDVPRNERSD